MSAPRRIRRCPYCGKRLRWERVEVDRGSDGPAPEEAFAYAQCRCGLLLEWSPRQIEAEEDEDDDTPADGECEQWDLWTTEVSR